MNRRGDVVCSNAVTVSQPAIEARVRDVLDAIAKDPDRLKVLVAEHNRRIAQTNEGQLSVINGLRARKAEVEKERDRFVDAIGRGKGTVDALLKALSDRQAEMADLDRRIEEAEALVQPLLLPRPRAIQDFVSGRVSVFAGDFTLDKEFLSRVLDAILVYPDGAVVVRFAEDSLFAPMAAAELRGDHVGNASVEDARKLHQEFLAETREWCSPDAEVRVIEGDGLIAYQAISPPRNRSGKTVGVPSGIRTRVTGVKGRRPGPG